MTIHPDQNLNVNWHVWKVIQARLAAEEEERKIRDKSLKKKKKTIKSKKNQSLAFWFMGEGAEA